MKAPAKAPSDRVSAFLLIAVAIPIFGLVLRLILETPAPGSESPKIGREAKRTEAAHRVRGH